MRLSTFYILAIMLVITALASSSILANPVIPIATQPQPIFTPSTPNIDAKGYILIDATTGKVLAEKDADIRMPPASLTKLMSLYLISKAIKAGSIHWDDKVRISTKAWKMEGSRMFVKVGDEVPVKDLVQGIIVESGNDATVAMAEYIAGTEETFTDMMDDQAKLLGMQNSHFTDSTGLPNPDHYSTPRDFATLAQAYISSFPEDYHLFSEKWFTYNGIRQPNRNRLLWQFQYADGLKTGHTSDAGYCLVASARKNGMRLISVVMGAPTERVRTDDSIRLLTYGFRFYETRQLYNAANPLTQARVWQGTSKHVPLGLAKDLYVTMPAGQYKRLQATMQLNSPMKAPIIKGQSYGQVNVILNNQSLISAPLIALENNPKGSLWRRISDAVDYGFHKVFSKSDEKANTG
ncbi:MAG: serine-type D-Ala-D-Ala carboxypeptidase [Gammaproteobacteria bacterium RIFCSPHIGHO2_12_FULL_41_20]|nr:MAG: serine-type D-Ala-D-Ala carboxypeptidase [Gammaproteobacteria bacterium RIFCSPHIGHO2_12_FULL_41_20]